jgi:alpha-tubulin suppressor-like RCC1 family protein
VSGLAGVKSVAVGGHFSLAVKSDGTVWAWGNNGCYQLGDNTTTEKTAPIQVRGLTDVVSIAAGLWHSLAVKSDGTVWAWGGNDNGQLGDGSTTNRATPVLVSWLRGVKSIAAGDLHSLACTTDGAVCAWGNNRYGQLGTGDVIIRVSPSSVSWFSSVNSIAAGLYHSLAIRSDGTVWTWGIDIVPNNKFNYANFRCSCVPMQVKTDGIRFIQVAGGQYHTLALREDGTVWAWGYNDYGQRGDGTTLYKTTPLQVGELTEVISIAAGDYHSLALKSEACDIIEPTQRSQLNQGFQGVGHFFANYIT